MPKVALSNVHEKNPGLKTGDLSRQIPKYLLGGEKKTRDRSSVGAENKLRTWGLRSSKQTKKGNRDTCRHGMKDGGGMHPEGREKVY